MEESVTIRGFTCKADEAPIVNEIIRIVEQEEPRLGTVYSVKNGKNGMLKAAICGPYENGTKGGKRRFSHAVGEGGPLETVQVYRKSGK